MKNLLIITASLLIGTAAFAETLKVEAITPFTTVNPPSQIQVKSLGELQITSRVKIKKGDILMGRLTNIKDPKRLKRNATFKYEITTIMNTSGNTISVNENNLAKYVPPFKLNKKEVAKDAALTVGDFFVQGISIGYHAVEGAVKPEKSSNRISSAVRNVYEHSILSLANKGEEVVINTGDIFGLKINSKEELEEYETKYAPNYTYEVK